MVSGLTDLLPIPIIHQNVNLYFNCCVSMTVILPQIQISVLYYGIF